MSLATILTLTFTAFAQGCTDYYMKFSDPNLRMSGRTLDLGAMQNWTITTWPVGSDGPIADLMNWEPKYGVVSLTANWIGDEHYGFPSFFGDALNEHGLSCSLLTLVDTEYEPKSDTKRNVFAGVFCHWASQLFTNVNEVQDALDGIAIWGPDALAQHFVLRDATGASLVIECMNGEKQVYRDENDGVNTFGIMTNEPAFDYHLMNIKHYEWKRGLARQAVPLPGSFYPEERYLRVHMIKSGMADLMESTTDYQTAFSLTSQVLNSVTVPMGLQYGTDSGENSGEGDGDHTVWGVVRDHANKIYYWRDATNPTFRRLRLEDVVGAPGTARKTMKLETGPYFVDMANNMDKC